MNVNFWLQSGYVHLDDFKLFIFPNMPAEFSKKISFPNVPLSPSDCQRNNPSYKYYFTALRLSINTYNIFLHLN